MKYKRPSFEREQELLMQVNIVIGKKLKSAILAKRDTMELPEVLEAVAEAGISDDPSELLLIGAMVASGFSSFTDSPVNVYINDDSERKVN